MHAQNGTRSCFCTATYTPRPVAQIPPTITATPTPLTFCLRRATRWRVHLIRRVGGQFTRRSRIRSRCSMFFTAWSELQPRPSLGGMITAGLVQQYPNRFSGALPMCGVVAGGVGLWNEALDGAFAFNTLLAGEALQVVNITNPTQDYNTAEGFLGADQATAQGKARIALVAAFAAVPGWIDPASPAPSSPEYATQEFSQFESLAYADFRFRCY